MKKKHILLIPAALGAIQLCMILIPSQNQPDDLNKKSYISHITSSIKNQFNNPQQNNLSETGNNNNTENKKVNQNIGINNNNKTSPNSCIAIGPFRGENLEEMNKLISEYKKDFRDQLYTTEITIPSWDVIIPSKYIESSSRTMEKFQNMNINLEKVVFKENGDVFINSFNIKEEALNLSKKLNDNKQDNVIIKKSSTDKFFYMVHPKQQYYARLHAIDTHFNHSNIIKIDCKNNN